MDDDIIDTGDHASAIEKHRSVPKEQKNDSSPFKDDELAALAGSGDGDAAELLIRRYYSSILRYCRWHCPDMETAEDLTQETFIRLFRHLRNYKARGSFKTWLYTIANRLCIDESRKIRFSPLEDQNFPAADDSRLHRIEDRDQILHLLKFLSPEQREAILLRFEEDLSFLEIARIMGCSLRTAQSRIRNGLKIMRKEMDDA